MAQAREIHYQQDGLAIEVDGKAASGLTGMAREIHLARLKLPETASEAEFLALTTIGPAILFGVRGQITLGEITYILPADASKVPVLELFDAIPESLLAQWLELAYRENPGWAPGFGPRTDDEAKKNSTSSI